MDTMRTKAEKTAALFVLTCTGVLVFFLAWRTIVDRWQIGSTTVTVTLEESHGIIAGTKVTIMGIEAGKVEDVSLSDDNKVLVTLRIDRRFSDRMTEGTKAIVVVPSLWGEPTLDIKPGRRGAARMAKGQHIPAMVASSFLDQVSEYVGGLDSDTGDSMLASVKKVINNLEPVTANLIDITEKLPPLLDGTKKVIDKLALAADEIANVARNVSAVTDSSKKAIDGLAGAQKKIEGLIDELSVVAAHLGSVIGKVDKGQGTLGKFVNEDDLYRKIEESVDATRDLVTSIARTNTYVGISSAYSAERDLMTSKVHLRIVPRESRYFLLGGTFFSIGDDSDITEEDEDEMHIVADLMMAQKVLNNKLTLRFGLLEGKPGAGADWELTKRRTWLTIEARGAFEDADMIDEHLDTTFARVKLRSRLWRNVWLEAGVDNVFDEPSFMVGVGLEYLDRDITKVVGLIGAGL